MFKRRWKQSCELDRAELECPSSAFITGMALSSWHSNLTLLNCILILHYILTFSLPAVVLKIIDFYSDFSNELLFFKKYRT